MAESGWQRYLDLATGLTEVTRRTAESVVRGLVKQGEVAADAAERAVDELLQRSEENRHGLADLVRTETQKAVGALGLASQSTVEVLQAKVAALESATGGAGPPAEPEGPAAPPAKKASPAAKKKASPAASTTAARDADRPSPRDG